MKGKEMPSLAGQAQMTAQKYVTISESYFNPNTDKSQSSPSAATIESLMEIGKLNTHIEAIHHLASSCERGLLVGTGFGENPHTGVRLNPAIKHFKIGRHEDMSQWFEQLTKIADRNVYMPLAVLNPDLHKNQKGSEADIIAVLGLVADFDDPAASKWPDRIPYLPSYVLETSPGRFQVGFLFNSPMSPRDAKDLAMKLKRYCRCDHGTADISHVWRIPGTLNWPNKKKLSEGRSTEPWEVRAI